MTISVEQAKSTFAELIQRTSRGETVIITQNQKPIAELRPLAVDQPKPKFGACKGQLAIVADDEEHLNDFSEYVK